MTSPLTSESYELEKRLSRMERDIAARALANLEPPGVSRFTLSVRPPRVSGLQLSAPLGQIAIAWNSVGISDLKRYEVQISTSPTMSNAITAFTRETQYSFAQAQGGTTYYIRVRAINNSEASGNYSGILNSATGQITETDIAEGAITTTKIANLAVKFAKIGDLEVGTIKIQDEAVSSTEIDTDTSAGASATATAQATITHGGSVLALMAARRDNVSPANLGSFQLRRGGVSDTILIVGIDHLWGGDFAMYAHLDPTPVDDNQQYTFQCNPGTGNQTNATLVLMSFKK